jgi:hypothetical protein
MNMTWLNIEHKPNRFGSRVDHAQAASLNESYKITDRNN